MKIALRLIFSLITIVALVAFSFSVWQARQEELRLKNDLERRASIIADSLKISVEPLLLTDDTKYLQRIVDKFSNDPISVKMLKVNGNELMNELGIKPGPKIGLILNSLLAEVLDDPARNKKEYLKQRIHELDKKSPEELKQSLEKIEKALEEEEKDRMKKYYV